MKRLISIVLSILMVCLALPVYAAETSVPESADVIVVGAGLGGLTAASKAAELGATVILFEQTDHVGGSCMYSGVGHINGAGTIMQAEAGIEDSPELFYEDCVRIGGGEQNINPALAKSYTEQCGPAVDWLDKVVGVDFGDRQPSFGMYIEQSVPRVYAPIQGGYTLVTSMAEYFQKYIDSGNAYLVYNTFVNDIVIEDGIVTGVTVENEDGTTTVYYAPSIILATGGYGYNKELLQKYNFGDCLSSAPVTAIGTGYFFAEKAGAAFMGMDYCTARAGAIPTGDGFTYRTNAKRQYPGVLWIDKNGKRLADEMGADTNVISDVWSYAKDSVVYILFTESMIAEDYGIISNFGGSSELDKIGTKEENKALLDELIEDGRFVFKANTIEELAEQMGVDPAALRETIDTYNKSCDAGIDSEFGRTANLQKFENDTFYAAYTLPYVMLTSGGVVINGNAEILNNEGQVIPGLYACGEMVGMGNIGGHTSIGGIGHGLCVTFGTAAAVNAVERAELLAEETLPLAQ